MQKLLTALIGPAIAALVLAAQPGAAEAQSRIKDIVSIEGVRSNQLVGYGLVVGLNGTGDSVRNSPFTRQSLEGMMERQGVNIRGANLNTKNVAAVMITADLPPSAAALAYRQMALAAARFRLSARPAIGMDTRWSAPASTVSGRPCASLPNNQACGWASSAPASVNMFRARGMR